MSSHLSNFLIPCEHTPKLFLCKFTDGQHKAKGCVWGSQRNENTTFKWNLKYTLKNRFFMRWLEVRTLQRWHCDKYSCIFAPTNDCFRKAEVRAEVWELQNKNRTNSLLISLLLFSLFTYIKCGGDVTAAMWHLSFHPLSDYPLICEFCAGRDSIALSADSHPSNNISIISICFDYKGH